jgi:hypothetical protein
VRTAALREPFLTYEMWDYLLTLTSHRYQGLRPAKKLKAKAWRPANESNDIDWFLQEVIIACQIGLNNSNFPFIIWTYSPKREKEEPSLTKPTQTYGITDSRICNRRATKNALQSRARMWNLESLLFLPFFHCFLEV